MTRRKKKKGGARLGFIPGPPETRDVLRVRRFESGRLDWPEDVIRIDFPGHARPVLVTLAEARWLGDRLGEQTDPGAVALPAPSRRGGDGDR